MSEEIKNLIGEQVMAIVSLRTKLRISEEKVKELEDVNLPKDNQR